MFETRNKCTQPSHVYMILFLCIFVVKQAGPMCWLIFLWQLKWLKGETPHPKLNSNLTVYVYLKEALAAVESTSMVWQKKEKSLIDWSMAMEMPCTMTPRSASLRPPNKPMERIWIWRAGVRERVTEEEEGGLYPCETSPNKDSLFLGPDNPHLSKQDK